MDKNTNLSFESNAHRREFLHSVWATPAIISVSLPAHAQTSQELTGCMVEVSDNAISLSSIELETLSTPIDITVSNTGDTPLAHPDTSSDIAGLSLTSFNILETVLEFPNGGIPNPLMPGQSHTIQLSGLQADSCPFDGQLDVQFSRDGTECLESISLSCEIPLVLSCSMTLSRNAVSFSSATLELLTPAIDIEITNTGEAPLTHPSPSAVAGGLSFPTSNLVLTQTSLATNGGIPNELMPGESHTVQLTSLGLGECPANGTVNVTFARNGIECVMPITVTCILPPP